MSKKLEILRYKFDKSIILQRNLQPVNLQSMFSITFKNN